MLVLCHQALVLPRDHTVYDNAGIHQKVHVQVCNDDFNARSVSFIADRGCHLKSTQTFSFEIMYLTAIHQNRKFLRCVHHNIQHNCNSRYNKMATLWIEHANVIVNSEGVAHYPFVNAIQYNTIHNVVFCSVLSVVIIQGSKIHTQPPSLK